MKSLYAEYIESRGGKEIIETEKGFATYYYLEDGCYIEDIFIKEEFRHSGEARKLAGQITEIAKSKGFKKLYGTVCPVANGSTYSLKAFLNYGFQLDKSLTNLIILKKEI